jgi:predicted nucleic acid-binding protein
MRRVLVDTSALMAMIDSRDCWFNEALDFLQREVALYLVPDTVFSETLTLIKARLGAAAAVTVGSRIQESATFRLHYLNPEDHRATWRIFARYTDKEWSYVDCSILALAQRLDVAEVFAFDHHFDQMTGLGLERVPAVLRAR